MSSRGFELLRSGLVSELLRCAGTPRGLPAS